VLDEVSRLREQLEQEARQREQQRIQALVEAALEDGRILPNQRELFLRLAQSDFEATRMALEALPPRVPTQLPQLQPAQSIPRARRDEPPKRAALSDNDLAVAQLVGVSQEALLKYGGDE
jgi:phage I-like protein